MTACTAKATFNVGNVMWPVLLGNSGNAVGPDIKQMHLKENFEVKKLVNTWFGGNRVDLELVRLIRTPQDIIHVNEVTFDSGSAFILIGAGVGNSNSVGINGGIYRMPARGDNDAR